MRLRDIEPGMVVKMKGGDWREIITVNRWRMTYKVVYRPHNSSSKLPQISCIRTIQTASFLENAVREVNLKKARLTAA